MFNEIALMYDDLIGTTLASADVVYSFDTSLGHHWIAVDANGEWFLVRDIQNMTMDEILEGVSTLLTSASSPVLFFTTVLSDEDLTNDMIEVRRRMVKYGVKAQTPFLRLWNFDATMTAFVGQTLDLLKWPSADVRFNPLTDGIGHTITFDRTEVGNWQPLSSL